MRLQPGAQKFVHDGVGDDGVPFRRAVEGAAVESGHSQLQAIGDRRKQRGFAAEAEGTIDLCVRLEVQIVHRDEQPAPRGIGQELVRQEGRKAAPRGVRARHLTLGSFGRVGKGANATVRERRHRIDNWNPVG